MGQNCKIIDKKAALNYYKEKTGSDVIANDIVEYIQGDSFADIFGEWTYPGTGDWFINGLPKLYKETSTGAYYFFNGTDRISVSDDVLLGTKDSVVGSLVNNIVKEVLKSTNVGDLNNINTVSLEFLSDSLEDFITKNIKYSKTVDDARITSIVLNAKYHPQIINLVVRELNEYAINVAKIDEEYERKRLNDLGYDITEGNEHRAHTKLNAYVKMHLASFPIYETINGKSVPKRNPDANMLVEYHNENELFTRLLKHFSGLRPVNKDGKFLSVKDQINQKFKDEVIKYDQVFEDIYKLFNSDSRFADALIKALNVTEYHYQANAKILGKDQEEEDATMVIVKQKSADKNNMHFQLKRKWASNAISNLTIYDPKTKRNETNTKAWNRLKELNNSYDSLKTNEERLRTIREMFDIIGMDIDDRVLENLPKTNEAIPKIEYPPVFQHLIGHGRVTNSLFQALDTRHDTKLQAIYQAFDKQDSALRTITQEQEKYQLDFNDGNVPSTDGKKNYKWAPATQLHRMAMQVKAGDYSVLEELADMPFFQSNSIVRYLLAQDWVDKGASDVDIKKYRAERAKEFEIGLLHKTYDTNGNEGDNKNLSAADKIVNQIVNSYAYNAVDTKKAIFQTLNAADKSRTLTTTGIELQNFQGILVMENEVEELPGGIIKVKKIESLMKRVKATVKKTLLPRLEAEFKKMNAELSKSTTIAVEIFREMANDAKLYKDDKRLLIGEADVRAEFHKRLIEKGFDTISSFNLNKKGNFLNNYESAFIDIIDNQGDEAIGLVKNNILKSGAKAYQFNIFNIKGIDEAMNLADPNLDSATEVLANNLIDQYEKFLQYARDNNVFSEGKSAVIDAIGASDLNIFQKMMNGFWPQFVFNIDQTQYYWSDPAYYKNFIDLTKRVQSMYTDGTYLNITDEKDIDYQVAIINDVERGSQVFKAIKAGFTTNPELADPYGDESDGVDSDGTEVADGWSVITPERFRFIMEKAGKITDENKELFDKMVDAPHKLTESDTNKIIEFMKPIKGVYGASEVSNNGRYNPTYFKYSQAVIIPGMSPSLDKLLAEMRTSKVDELAFHSAVKVGAKNFSSFKISDNLDLETINLIPNTYSNLNYKIQQDLPNKGYKHEALLASQVQKNILGLIDIRDANGQPFVDTYGNEYTDQEMLDMVYNSTSDKVKSSFNKALRRFGLVVNKDGEYEIEDDEKFFNVISKQLNDNTDPALIDLIKAFGKVDYVPQIREKLNQVMLSELNKSITKPKVPGGSLVQMSGVFSKNLTNNEKASVVLIGDYADKGLTNLKPPVVENGRITKGQVLIGSNLLQRFYPQHDGEDFETYTKRFNEDLRPSDGSPSKIDKRIFDAIGYRIPNQGPSSNEALEIVGILPPSLGDSIILYDEVVTKTGSDFDIDKMFMWFPEVKYQFTGVGKAVDDFIKTHNLYADNVEQVKKFLKAFNYSENEISEILSNKIEGKDQLLSIFNNIIKQELSQAYYSNDYDMFSKILNYKVDIKSMMEYVDKSGSLSSDVFDEFKTTINDAKGELQSVKYYETSNKYIHEINGITNALNGYNSIETIADLLVGLHESDKNLSNVVSKIAERGNDLGYTDMLSNAQVNTQGKKLSRDFKYAVVNDGISSYVYGLISSDKKALLAEEGQFVNNINKIHQKLLNNDTNEYLKAHPELTDFNVFLDELLFNPEVVQMASGLNMTNDIVSEFNKLFNEDSYFNDMFTSLETRIDSQTGSLLNELSNTESSEPDTELNEEQVIEAVRQYSIKNDAIEEVDCKTGDAIDNGNISIQKAANGLKTSFTSGKSWDIVKDLDKDGYKTHAEGGVNIIIDDGKVMVGGDSKIHARYGMFIPNNKK